MITGLTKPQGTHYVMKTCTKLSVYGRGEQKDGGQRGVEEFSTPSKHIMRCRGVYRLVNSRSPGIILVLVFLLPALTLLVNYNTATVRYNQVRKQDNIETRLVIRKRPAKPTTVTYIDAEVWGPGTVCGLLSGDFVGGLGNHMFKYAGLYALAKANSLRPFITDESNLPKYFTLGNEVALVPKVLVPSAVEKYHFVNEKKACAYDVTQDLTKFGNKLVFINGFLQSWKYFADCASEIRAHFTFKDHIMREVRGSLARARLQSTNPFNVTLVGVHVRRGDMLDDTNNEIGYQVPEMSYFTNAMQYFKDKYKLVIFVICSNDINWARSSFGEPSDIMYAGGFLAEVDLALLAHCDHVIMSVGTYGWWAGYLAGGDVVYFDDPVREGSMLAEQFVYRDFYPPQWKPMGNTGAKTRQEKDFDWRR